MAENIHLYKISAQNRSDCFTCPLQKTCLIRSFFPFSDGMSRHDDLAKPQATLKKGETLIVQGMNFTSLFVVRSGSLKQVAINGKAEQIVIGFYLPGEMVGLDALASNEFPGSVVAMETSSVCELPFDKLDRFGMRFDEFRLRLYASISQGVNEERVKLRLLLNKTAEARLAFFFMRLSDRFRRLGFSASRFNLPMSRSDIGDYLGVSDETVSRVLSSYKKKNIVLIKGRGVHMLNMEKLLALSESNGRQGSKK